MEGDFQAYGYFPGFRLQIGPPPVWLVVPSLQFHPANEIQLRYLSSELQVTRIGVSEKRRNGLRVVPRQ
jgi:hypothetical protein